MLRKNKTANIVAAISVIAILLSSSISTIPVFAQNEQQQQQPGGVGSPQGNQTATGSNASLTFHDEMRRMWLEHDIYIRLMLVTYKSGNIQDFNATVTKALKAQEQLVNFTAPYLGQANTQNLSTALKMHITIYTQILAAAKANDTAALNANLTLWYNNAKEISTLLETGLSRAPAGNQTMPGGNQTVPGGNQTVPSGNQSQPSGNQTVPSGNQTLPGGNQTVPGGNQTVPGGNKTIPGGNQTQPSANQSKPVIIWILPNSAANMSSVGFRPNNATVIIGVNNTVTWINNDTAEHTVVGVSGPTGAPMPNSSNIQSHQNYTFTFTVPGTYVYWCRVHMWMQGIVNVKAGQAVSGGNQTVPGGNQTVPGGNQTIPGGNQTVPGDNQTTPSGNQTVPGGNQTVPGGNKTIPGGNQTLPSANQSKPAIIWIVAGSAANMSSVGFRPNNATVKIGVNNTVTWVNNDTSEHTVSGVSGPPDAPMPGSGYILPNQNYTLTFTVPGTYRYRCSIHTWIQGTITVEGNQTIPSGNQTQPGGNQTVPGGNQTVPSGNQTVPSGNQTVPGGNQSQPSGNQTVPGGNQTVPGGNQTQPGANQTIPGGNLTRGRVANVSILQDMNTHLNFTLRMTMEYLNGNYTASLLTFQEIIKGTLKLADIISDAIITMNPSKFTSIGTVSRP
ncbi:MAG: cupredoxin domain-containing protein [Thaumarchaeota archaeon]|nr:cupredoxin domain-containing protein [Nitrososphaerota archaeon]MCL5318535.1 cupredoxin domain-containing protein [Nitrososphaerota archaeon]